LYSHVTLQIHCGCGKSSIGRDYWRFGKTQGHVLWALVAAFAYTELMQPEQHIADMYATLLQAWGRQHWWPAQSAFEVIVGAYLTQNTNWSNVELALHNLRTARGLSVAGIRNVRIRRLEALLRPSGYFRQKARRLKLFVRFLDRTYGGSLKRMFAQPTSKLRHELLELEGVGPETADSILLYAGQHAVFVIDAYTRRIAERHGLAHAKISYDDLRLLFERGLAAEPSSILAAESRTAPALSPSRMSLADRSPLSQTLNEMHALMVGVGKQYCLKSEPRCETCPLRALLPDPLPTPDL
jgi:endonuclease III related protein